MKLEEYLKLSRIKQKDFAEIGGFSVSALNNWIRGRRKPSIKNALTIQEMTKNKVKPKDFLD